MVGVGQGGSVGHVPLFVTEPPEVVGVVQEQTIKLVYADKLNWGNEILVNGLVRLLTVMALPVLLVIVN